MIVVRGVLLAAGIGLIAIGGFLMATTLSPPQLVALVIWLAAVIVVHDAVLAPALSVLHARWWRRADTRPKSVTAVAQVGFVVGGVLTLFVVPEIWAQGRGNPNPTILVGDYAMRLLVAWVVIGLVVLVWTRVVTRRVRR